MLSIKLMMEMACRAQGDGKWWTAKTVELAGEAARQAVYCLDAPDDIPAGGVYADEIAGEAVPMPMTADREQVAFAAHAADSEGGEA